ncbi:MAG: general secretion pathway protein GspK [Deltaproteobacteria bacterium]|nr:general secretion pathway protein GspK [Deltaproteobacteria bacterium]
MRSARSAERGVVLVMVLAVTAIVSMLVLDLNANMFVVQKATHIGDRRTVAYYNARSAVGLGRLTLVLQGLVNGQLGGQGQGGSRGVDVTPWSNMVFDFFANEDSRNTLLQGFAGIPGDMVKGFAVFDGNFAVTVVDEDGRINLNVAAQGDESQQFIDRVLSWLIAPEQYEDLFSKEGADGQITTRDQLVAALIDWADTNDQMYQRAGASRGAEDNSYQSLPHPYMRKDCPYDSVEELRRVRGVGEDFWSTFVDPDPADPDARTLTVWGQGKINVNSAPPRVLAAVICALAMDQKACDPRHFERVLLLVDAVRQAGGGHFASPGHFTRAVSQGVEDVPGIPIDGGLADKWLTTIGKVFSLYVEGRAPVGGRPGGAAATRGRARPRAEQVSRAEHRAAEAAQRTQGGGAGASGAGGEAQAADRPEDREVVVRLHVVMDTTSPWDTQGGRILYWREL